MRLDQYERCWPVLEQLGRAGLRGDIISHIHRQLGSHTHTLRAQLRVALANGWATCEECGKRKVYMITKKGERVLRIRKQFYARVDKTK